MHNDVHVCRAFHLLSFEFSNKFDVAVELLEGMVTGRVFRENIGVRIPVYFCLRLRVNTTTRRKTVQYQPEQQKNIRGVGREGIILQFTSVM